MSSTTGSAAQLQQLTIANDRGVSATLSAFGARLLELRVPDRDGELDNVILGFDDVAAYHRHVDLYFGATIGRVAGRIARASFTLEGHRYELAQNEGGTHLHGGAARSFDRVDWSAQRVVSDLGDCVRFDYESPHLEEGYPGRLRARAEYAISDRNELWTVFRAVSDAPTPVNMTNHAYWNLSGAGPEPILDHELMIAAEHVVGMGDDLVPTGALERVAGTALDFRRPRRLGERLPEAGREPWPGFDAAYVLDGRDRERDVAVSLWDPSSGRLMEVVTTEPSIQMYTANRVPEITGRGGRPYRAGNSICLEPQRMPDAVNRPEFDPILIGPGEEYVHTTCYRFSTR